MRTLVVGGSGFLGYHVVTELLARGHQVATLTRRPPTHLPPNVTTHLGDLTTLTDPGEPLHGQDALVFAAGADDRTVPPAPAYPYFAAHNVTPVRRLLAAAQAAEVARAVVLGSYFTALDRTRPQLRLAERHPYVRSRAQQAQVALAAGATVLEIPFVFGSAPGSRPLVAPLLPWLRSGAPLLAPPGGTAAVTVTTLARATATALERGHSGPCPVVDENLPWANLLARLATAAGRPRPTVHRLPPGVLHAALLATGPAHALRRREPGLRPGLLAGVLTRELFLDETSCRALAGPAADLDQALHETVHACR
jgi:dihydroflavonol-4-reductase